MTIEQDPSSNWKHESKSPSPEEGLGCDAQIVVAAKALLSVNDEAQECDDCCCGAYCSKHYGDFWEKFEALERARSVL